MAKPQELDELIKSMDQELERIDRHIADLVAIRRGFREQRSFLQQQQSKRFASGAIRIAAGQLKIENGLERQSNG